MRLSSGGAQIRVRICKKSLLVPELLGSGHKSCFVHSVLVFSFSSSFLRARGICFLVEAEIFIRVVLPAEVLQGWDLSSARGWFGW